jgi:hypothetical protein
MYCKLLKTKAPYGIKGISVLFFLPGFDLVQDTSLEHMHQLDMGIAKSLFSDFVTQNDINLADLDDKIDILKVNTPSSMQNWNVTFEDFTSWKAIHWRYFVIYFSRPLFQTWDILLDNQLQLWDLLVEISIMVSAA